MYTTADTAERTSVEPGEGELTSAEVFWRDLQPWLLECGYQLRPRYRKGWIPSWKKSKKFSLSCEDGQPIIHGSVLDAVRVGDGVRVGLKKVKKSLHPYEEEIARYLGSEPLLSDPHNHCVPIFEALHPPTDLNFVILVMPLLRSYDSPRFDTVGEVVECFRQLFEGLQFMHEHHIAHRFDLCAQNFMFDRHNIFPHGYHFVLDNRTPDIKRRAKHFTRTQRPVKYYITDYGLSRRYNLNDGIPLELPILGGDKTVPEFKSNYEAQNPFPTDVYYVGNLVRQYFLDGSRQARLRIHETTIDEMVQEDPTKRPTMDEVVRRFDDLVQGLSFFKLRSRVPQRKDNIFIALEHCIPHWLRKFRSIIRRTPAMPIPAD
ncbi:hypothetical protein CPB84DRAFT_1736865 [Gymnopilus junonius]|uniref:Protein kinase domain-containing protein n=1 Tax=Gymnopilus junonius TaxID=109634 RepID=A0A9P5TGY2_GYMJU|nr:hypothetical protein CPB84DRAFT_1736865 [Gymnopilus junonius]